MKRFHQFACSIQFLAQVVGRNNWERPNELANRGYHRAKIECFLVHDKLISLP